jgi:hypothetical protein
MTSAHADLARRGYELLVNFSAGRRTYLASLATGWRPLAPLGVRRRQDASIPPREDLFAALDGAAQRPGTLPVSIDRAPRPGAMLAVLDRLPRDPRLHQVRDERYLGWRYRNPISRYRFLFWEEAKACGYLVLQTSLRQRSTRGSRVNVIEWEATGARARDGLLRCALEWGAFPEVRVWAASMPRSAQRLLRDLGFRPLVGRRGVPPHPSAVLVRLLGRRASGRDRWALGGRSLRDPASWNLRMACSDAV